MINIDDVKKKREAYERKIEDILKELEKELPPIISLESAVVIKEPSKTKKTLKCHIKLEVEDINK